MTYYHNSDDEVRVRYRVKDSACKDCLFFNPDRDDEQMGECRRQPPTRDGWPSTGIRDWCGEFLWQDVPE